MKQAIIYNNNGGGGGVLKNILFSFIGKRDPYPSNNQNEGEGPLITLCRNINPDEIFLVATYDSDRKGKKNSILNNLEESIYWLESEGIIGKEFVHDEKIIMKDPRDYEKLLPEVRDRLKKYLASKNNNEISSHINLSSGTSQQETTFILLAENGYFPRPHTYQVSAPKYVDAEEERCNEIKTTFIREENIIDSASGYLKNYEFHSAAKKLKNLQFLTLHSSRRTLAEFYYDLIKSYEKWDLIKYKEAYDRLKSTYNSYKSLKEIRDIKAIVEEQVEILKFLRNDARDKEGKETSTNLTDLYHNMRRLYKRGQYTDVLARFWRIVEGTFYYRLRRGYGIEPDNIYKSKNTKHRKQLESKLNLNVSSLNFANSAKALEKVFSDSIYRRLMEKELTIFSGAKPQVATEGSEKVKSEYEDLREKRNFSVAAHGMRPVSWDEADSALKIANLFLEEFEIKNTSDKKYPFSCEKLTNIADHLKNI